MPSSLFVSALAVALLTAGAAVAQIPDLTSPVPYPPDGIGQKRANVIVVIYDPSIPSEGGKRLTEVMGWNDPDELTQALIDDVRVASNGYINYEVVLRLDLDKCPPWRSGFRYDPDDLLDDIRHQNWKQGDGASYEGILVENDLVEAIEELDVTEVWLWGAPGMHWDEYAMFIPGRDDRLPPTDNPWFYRPYDIPDLGKSLWVMGFNYERGEGEMLESYCHRAEGILALAVAGGVWDTSRDDPWNVFTRVDKDHPGESHVGGVHYAPNSRSDYDWGHDRYVQTYALDWRNYPDLKGTKAIMNCYDGWGPDIVTHHCWWLGMLPKALGQTEYGYNNWWIYVANFDEDLQELPPDEE